jgi:hypothetical protein
MHRLLPIVGLLVGGCVVPQIGVDFVPTNGSPRPMYVKAPEQVMITSTPPTRPFAEVAFVEGRSYYHGYDDPARVVASMRASAAGYGCDALMITGPNNEVSGLGGGSTHTHAGYHGVCLVFLDQPYAPPPPPPSPTSMLFRSSSGGVYRVEPDSFEAARRMGWVPVEAARQ